MLGSVDASFRFLIESFPRLLLLSEENDMKPLIEFLESIGVPKDSLGKVLLLYPPVMLSKAEEMKIRVAAALEKVCYLIDSILLAWSGFTDNCKNGDLLI